MAAARASRQGRIPYLTSVENTSVYIYIYIYIYGNGTKGGSGPSGLKEERRKFLHFIFLLFKSHFKSNSNRFEVLTKTTHFNKLYASA
jgi:hypothetical protein